MRQSPVSWPKVFSAPNDEEVGLDIGRLCDIKIYKRNPPTLQLFLSETDGFEAFHFQGAVIFFQFTSLAVSSTFLISLFVCYNS